MTPALVAQHQQHVAQLQGRGGAQLVDPTQHATPDHDLVLVETPVDRRRAFNPGVGGRHVQAGHMPAALGIAPHFQPGILDQQLLKAQLERQQRRHRQRGRHLRQAQGLAALRVAQHHIVQHKGRHPARAMHRNFTQLHRMPERAAGLRLDARTPIVQTGQNQPVQREPGHQDAGPGQQEQPEAQTQTAP